MNTNRKQYDITWEGGGIESSKYYVKDNPDPAQKKESTLTVWHWCTIVGCMVVAIASIVERGWVVAAICILTCYFEIRSALLYHEIQQLQDKVKSLENKQV